MEEEITPTEVESTPAPQPKKTFSWRDLLMNKAFDLLIVISGVSIAFQLNNWKLGSDQKSLEVFYHESLTQDIDKDVEVCEEILKSLRDDQNLVKRYLSTTKLTPHSVDSLGRVIYNILSFETFTDHQNTYQTLLQGNGLTSLSDPNLRTRITEYYATYTSIRRFESVYTNLLFKMHEYISPYCDYENQKITDPAILTKIQTRNLLIMVNGQLEDGIEAYTEALKNGKVLRESLR